ncbi:hypothetical protein ACYOEI_33600, partial [Singulisphaera rosea]
MNTRIGQHSKWIRGFVVAAMIATLAGAGTPEFRKLIDDAEYARLAAPHADALKKGVREAATKTPDHGLKVSGVLAPTPLEARGVGRDDIVVAADGKNLWGRQIDAEKPESVRLRVYSSAQDRTRELRLTTSLQTAFSIVRRPELVHLRSKNRNAAYDLDVFIALTTATTAPDFAETAWSRALKAGYPRNRLVEASGSEIALAQG